MVSPYPEWYEVWSSGSFLQVQQTIPFLSFWNLRNLNSSLKLGRCRLFIRTVSTIFSKIINRLSQRLHVQCNHGRGTLVLWQAIHVFPPLSSSYRCLKEISPVLTDNFTYSPVKFPKPIPPVLTNPGFRPHQGLERGCYPHRIMRWDANCSEWHALIHVSVNKSFQVIHSLIHIVCSQDTIPSLSHNFLV